MRERRVSSAPKTATFPIFHLPLRSNHSDVCPRITYKENKGDPAVVQGMLGYRGQSRKSFLQVPFKRHETSYAMQKKSKFMEEKEAFPLRKSTYDESLLYADAKVTYAPSYSNSYLYIFAKGDFVNIQGHMYCNLRA